MYPLDADCLEVAEREIRIIVRGPSDFEVIEGNRRCDHLCWEELLGQVVTLTHPDIKAPKFAMLTEEQIADHERRHLERMAALEKERDQKEEDQCPF